MSSPEEERGFIGLWPDQENAESDGASVVSGEAPDVEVVETFNVPAVIQLSPVLREALRRLDRIDLETIFSKRAVVMKTVPSFFERTLQECNAHRHDVGGSCFCSCPGCCCVVNHVEGRLPGKHCRRDSASLRGPVGASHPVRARCFRSCQRCDGSPKEAPCQG